MSEHEKLLQYLTEHRDNISLGEDSPNYDPNRDITTLFPEAVNEIWEDLAGEEVGRYYALAHKWNYTQEQLLSAYNTYIDTLMSFRHDVAETLDEAAHLTGFDQLDPRLTLIVEALVGRYMAAAWFYGIKDITVQGEDPPPFTGYDTFQKLLEEIKMGLDGVETDYAKTLKENNNEEDKKSGECETRPDVQEEGCER